MAFSLLAASRAKAKPITLFLIEYGTEPGSFYAYNNGLAPITYAGKTYEPMPIEHSKITVKASMDKTSIDVSVSIKAGVAELFTAYPPTTVVRMSIFRGHSGDTEYKKIWAGRVLSGRRESPVLTMTCEPSRTSMRRAGLRRHYQYSCPHVLYGPQCKASKSAATIIREVSSVSGNTLTMEVGWDDTPSGASRYLGGMVEWINSDGETEVRTINRVAGRVITLAGVARDVAAGDDVKVIRGCSRTMAGCNTHSNILNFGGCPFIPKTNPVGKINGFY